MAKAEATAQGDNPRFEVTPLPSQGLAPEKDRERFSPARLYEEFYGGREPMENVLRHQMVDRKAGRLSPHHLRSNQRRCWLSAG